MPAVPVRTAKATNKGYYNIKVVTDDGYTDTNFNRLGFQEAFALIQYRRVGRFIVKYLSRLGRNTIEVGQYIGVIFPRFGVEFISIHDGQETENASITHQKALLKEYAEYNSYSNLRYYVDDGYTGTNFNRPDFQRMMEDVENGIIETIIVKDMNRFGRNYWYEWSQTEITSALWL